MATMEERGISDLEFVTLLSALTAHPDQACAAVRSCAASKRFTAHQAAQLVRSVISVSPFDAVEVAVELYPRLINQGAFQLVLNEFESDADRDNVCHRLKLTTDGAVLSRGATQAHNLS